MQKEVDKHSEQELAKLDTFKIMKQTRSLYNFKEALRRELNKHQRVPMTEADYETLNYPLVQAFRDGRSSLSRLLLQVLEQESN